MSTHLTNLARHGVSDLWLTHYDFIPFGCVVGQTLRRALSNAVQLPYDTPLLQLVAQCDKKQSDTTLLSLAHLLYRHPYGLILQARKLASYGPALQASVLRHRD